MAPAGSLGRRGRADPADAVRPHHHGQGHGDARGAGSDAASLGQAPAQRPGRALAPAGAERGRLRPVWQGHSPGPRIRVTAVRGHECERCRAAAPPVAAGRRHRARQQRLELPHTLGHL